MIITVRNTATSDSTLNKVSGHNSHLFFGEIQALPWWKQTTQFQRKDLHSFVFQLVLKRKVLNPEALLLVAMKKQHGQFSQLKQKYPYQSHGCILQKLAVKQSSFPPQTLLVVLPFKLHAHQKCIAQSINFGNHWPITEMSYFGGVFVFYLHTHITRIDLELILPSEHAEGSRRKIKLSILCP